jgi:hypothetical protein
MGDSDVVSRRAYLAAGVTGTTTLAECPGGSGTTTAPPDGDGRQ